MCVLKVGIATTARQKTQIKTGVYNAPNSWSMKIKISKLDKEFSDYIRMRDKWTCTHCGKFCGERGRIAKIDCSHFWGRANKSTRWDAENADAHCFVCHQKLGANPELFREWKLNQLGEEKYKALMQRANSIKKWTNKELEELYEYYKKENRNMQSM